MLWIIDGYNLMHAWSPLPHPKTHPTASRSQKAFQRHRQKFLDWLGTHRARCHPKDEVEVVFDAYNAPQPTHPEVYFGLQVHYSYRTHADHWIEERLRSLQGRPAVTVVSDDHGVQHMANRRGIAWMECSDFLERWSRETPPAGSPPVQPSASAPPEEDKEKATLSAAELEGLLQAFQQRPVSRFRRRPLPRRPFRRQ
jgi:predicted RNA-binding protein with PIN domain